MKKLTLSPMQQRFCDEYLIDANGRQAAIRAGYSPKTAVKQAWQVLQLPKVKQYLTEKRAALSELLNINATQVLQEYARIAFFDISILYDENQKLIPLNELPPGTAASIANIKVFEKFIGTGAQRMQAGNMVNVSLHNKLAALDALAKHLGLFDKDNKQLKEDVNVVVYIGDERIGPE